MKNNAEQTFDRLWFVDAPKWENRIFASVHYESIRRYRLRQRPGHSAITYSKMTEGGLRLSARWSEI